MAWKSIYCCIKWKKNRHWIQAPGWTKTHTLDENRYGWFEIERTSRYLPQKPVAFARWINPSTSRGVTGLASSPIQLKSGWDLERLSFWHFVRGLRAESLFAARFTGWFLYASWFSTAFPSIDESFQIRLFSINRIIFIAFEGWDRFRAWSGSSYQQALHRVPHGSQGKRRALDGYQSLVARSGCDWAR